MAEETPVEEALIVKAKRAKAAGKKLRLKKPKRQAAPFNLEREYFREFDKILERMRKIVVRNIIKALPAMVADNEKKKPNLDSAERLDANNARKLAALIRATRTELRKKNPPEKLKKITDKLSRKVARFNKKQVGGAFESVLGVDLFLNEPFLKQDLEEFSIGNVNLIQNVCNDFIDKTQQTVLKGFRRGTRHEEIAKQILSSVKDREGRRSDFSKAKNRAKLIARDQINKLNGQLTQLRQENAGVKKYIWRTVRDIRVREKHRLREGEEFSWNKPPDDGHPGEPINCRCFPEPVLDDLI